MIRTAGGRRLPLTAIAVVLAAGTALAGIAPAQAAPAPAPDSAPAAAAVAIPAPTTYFFGYGTQLQPTIDASVRVDLTGIPDRSGLRYEYRIDEAGPWLTVGAGRVTGGDDPIEAPAPAGEHLFSVRVAGTVGGVPVVGAATAPERVRSTGASLPYTPEVVVDGSRVTFRWDVREALNGNLPEDSQFLLRIGDGDYDDVGAVGEITVDAGYDAQVEFWLAYGVVPDLWAYAEAIGVTGSAPGSAPLTSTPPPSILGRASVGTTLGVRTGLWQPAPVRLTYQWYADGKPILGATDATFTVDFGQVGARITVAVRGARDGYVSVTRTSAPTPRVQEPVLTAGTPSVTGVPAVGRTVTARPGIWRPGPVTFAYSWLRDGRPIPGATASTYVVAEADQGRVLSVRVTGAFTQVFDITRNAVSAGRRVA